MTKVLALDLSTSTGVAVFIDGKLTDHTVFKVKVKGNPSSENYPFNYLEMAEAIGVRVKACIEHENPDYIIIEETNMGKDRFGQKQLEFIHFAVSKTLHNLETKYAVRYIDSSAWRSILGIAFDTDQRKANKDRKAHRESKRLEISKSIYNRLHDEIKQQIQGLGKRAANKIIKKWDKEIKVMVGKEMRKVRSPQKKVDMKTLSVNYVNEHYKLNFKRSQNDIADAICVGFAFIKNNYSSIAPK